VGRIFQEARLREISDLTDTHRPAIRMRHVVSCNIRHRTEFCISYRIHYVFLWMFPKFFVKLTHVNTKCKSYEPCITAVHKVAV
jgi:hypothetical protein